MQFNESFGEWLKQSRKALDLTQTELAEQVGCAVVTIRKFEHGLARPSKYMIRRLADVFAISADERTSFAAFARHKAEKLPALPVSSRLEPQANLLPFAPPVFGRADSMIEAPQHQAVQDQATIALVCSLPVHAIILAHQGLPEPAAELLGLVAAYPEHLTGWMTQWSQLTHLCARLEAELGTEAYQAAWERGRTLDLETALGGLLGNK